MGKIIKPLLNEDGTQVVSFAKAGDWYVEGHTYYLWEGFPSEELMPIYYEEKWKPADEELYCYYHFNCDLITMGHNCGSTMDIFNIKIGNCFKTHAEAKDINNILKILDNMKKYYQDKQQEGK